MLATIGVVTFIAWLFMAAKWGWLNAFALGGFLVVGVMWACNALGLIHLAV